jgi:hypothetical protein
MAHGPEKLSEFLNRLAGSTALQNKYAADRDDVLAKSGLSAVHKKILKDEKLGPIRRALQDELGAQVFAVIKIKVIKASTP